MVKQCCSPQDHKTRLRSNRCDALFSRDHNRRRMKHHAPMTSYPNQVVEYVYKKSELSQHKTASEDVHCLDQFILRQDCSSPAARRKGVPLYRVLPG